MSSRWIGNKLVVKSITTISNKKLQKDSPTCNYAAGELAGVARTLTGIKWKCIETKCVSKGDKYDEFQLSPK